MLIPSDRYQGLTVGPVDRQSCRRCACTRFPVPGCSLWTFVPLCPSSVGEATRCVVFY